MKIITVNTWGTSGPYLERWNFLIKELERLRPDILCLQEVSGPDLIDRVRRTVDFPFSASCYGPGLAILSRHPVLEEQNVRYAVKSPVEDYDRRALIAQIKIGAQKMAIASTHFSWKPEDGKTRMKQAGELLRAVEKTGLPALLAGDFNDVTESAGVQKIKNAGYVDLFHLLHPEEPGLTWDNAHPFVQTHDVKLPDRRIDFLFLDQAFLKTHPVRSSDVVFNHPNPSGIFPSDHYGLLADISFT